MWSWKKVVAFVFFTPNGSNVFLAVAFKKFLNKIGITFTPELVILLAKISLGLGIWSLYKKGKSSQITVSQNEGDFEEPK